jgi:hypothetical protein
MMLAGAKALGDHSPALRDPAASLLPSVRTIREVALEIAYAVALKSQEEGLAPACETEALRREIVENQWTRNTYHAERDYDVRWSSWAAKSRGVLAGGATVVPRASNSLFTQR